jgi:hypothetical protein
MSCRGSMQIRETGGEGADLFAEKLVAEIRKPPQKARNRFRAFRGVF